MKKWLRAIVMSPVIVVFILFDVVKFPFVVLFFAPVSGLAFLSEYKYGNKGTWRNYLEYLYDITFMTIPILREEGFIK